jgi:hypothetical protein
MTDENLSAAPGSDAVSQPGLRASDEDRERVVDILRVSAGDGRLTTPELDQRLGVALTARTIDELTALTADLPVGQAGAGGTPETKDIVRIDYQGGNVARQGRWMVPRRMEIRAVGGNVKLDFTDAAITHPTLEIQAQVTGGRLILVTGPGCEVDTDDISVVGGKVKVRRQRANSGTTRLRVHITGEVLGGSVIAKPPRRTLRQVVRRRPGPNQLGVGTGP